mmetsp:Transcript_11741/g.16773  ORF Transcript_11741/g.16773 Transcript_11741/m.16773 type:complete len:389 (-) Transcript_11741:93-1259(-)
MDFLKGLGKGDKNKGKKNNQNPLDHIGRALGGGGGGGHRKFQGSGKSLGGSKPGKVVHIVLGQPGSLGVKVEKSPRGTAIVALVVEQSQAESAGLIRGDIVCHTDTNGQEEMEFDLFLALAKSPERPFVFDIRRIETKAANLSDRKTAESQNRKQAMIAAAEAREKAAKARTKPVKTYIKKDNQAIIDLNAAIPSAPQSEAAKRAVAAAKSGEAKLADELGYNPFETNKSTAGQARNATVATHHGAINAGAPTPLPAVSKPKEATTAAPDVPMGDAFLDAYTTAVTTNEHQMVVQSFSIMRKLLTNATTKGQNNSDPVGAAKFRRVRLSNAKIKSAITDTHGALDMMMSCGFQLTEEDGECFLMFPSSNTGPVWLASALKQMEQYEAS